MLMMGGTVANYVYLRDAIVDVAARSALWPHLMKGWNPQIAFMVSIGHVRPEAQGQIRYGIIRCGISPETSSQVVDDVAIDPVGIIGLPAPICSKNRSSDGRRSIEQPVTVTIKGCRDGAIVSIPESDLEKRSIPQYRLSETDVP